jgi:hypothetical protein
MGSAKRLRFGDRMIVTLKELDAAAANMKLCTVQASYLRSEPTNGVLNSKASMNWTSNLMRKLRRLERITKLNYVVCKIACL